MHTQETGAGRPVRGRAIEGVAGHQLARSDIAATPAGRPQREVRLRADGCAERRRTWRGPDGRRGRLWPGDCAAPAASRETARPGRHRVRPDRDRSGPCGTATLTRSGRAAGGAEASGHALRISGAWSRVTDSGLLQGEPDEIERRATLIRLAAAGVRDRRCNQRSPRSRYGPRNAHAAASGFETASPVTSRHSAWHIVLTAYA